MRDAVLKSALWTEFLFYRERVEFCITIATYIKTKAQIGEVEYETVSIFTLAKKLELNFPACKYERKGVWAIEQLAQARRAWRLGFLRCSLSTTVWR
jgi:hypothetical protein